MSGGIKKTKQLAVGLWLVLSLFTASVSACVCAHHAKQARPETEACHGHAEAAPETPAPETLVGLAAAGDCGCAQPAPRVFSKAETVKLEKQAAALPASKVELKTVSAVTTAAKNVYFEKPFYLSDSFYNLKSPRAPPAA